VVQDEIMDIDKLIKDFIRQLKSNAEPEHAKQEKRYLKSPFKFFGTRNGVKTRIVKEFKKAHKEISKNELWQLVDKLWQSDYHDLRRLAIKILKVYSDHIDLSVMPKLEKLLKTSTNWDQVDEISVHLVGRVLQKDLKEGKKWLIKWSKDKNFWLRRAGLLSQLLLFRHGGGDKKLFFRLAEKMLDESKYTSGEYTTKYMPEKMGKFFIRKCIGWVLREMSLKDPKSVVDFVNYNRNKMSGLSYREGTRRLPVKWKKLLI